MSEQFIDLNIEGFSKIDSVVATKLFECDTSEQKAIAISKMPKRYRDRIPFVEMMIITNAIDKLTENVLEFPEISLYLKQF